MKSLIDLTVDCWAWGTIWFFIISIGPWLLLFVVAVAVLASPFIVIAYYLFKAIAYLWKAFQ